MSDLETKILQLEKEMLEQGRARNFATAKRKEEELYKLAAKKLRMSFSTENPEENIKLLNVKIEECIKEQKWAKAQSFQQVLADISRQVEFASQEDNNVDEKSPAVEGGSRMYGHLTVLQAHPLVWYDGEEFHTFPPPPDFEKEKKAIVGALSHAKKHGGRIDVSFEAATTFRLSALLADPDNHLLHYSGHGHKKYVTMENWGAMQQLGVNDLKEFLFSGTGNLRFAFVSACHSQAVGQAFHEAGISHVVCCELDEQLDDAAAIEFTRNFYLHLACGQTLSHAFKMAKKATKIAPIDRDAKFLLLPEKKEDAEYHNVHLFSMTPSLNDFAATSANIIGLPPSPPSPFLGREMEMYKILDQLKHSRFTQITGEPGVGKSTLGHALCAYIAVRKHTFAFEDVCWLSSSVGNLEGDELGGMFKEVFEAIFNEQIPVKNDTITLWSKLIAEHLRDRRSLVFIDGCRMYSNKKMTKLCRFLEALLRNTSQVYVVLICPSGEEIVSKVIPYDARLKLGPLSMWSSVLLFGNSCRYVSEGLSPAVRTPVDLANLLVPKSQADATRVTRAMSNRCKEIFARVGEGNPDWICKEAEKMTKNKYLELVDMGKRQELQRENYDTRFALDKEWSRIAGMFEEAKKTYDVLQAKQLHTDLQELGQLRDVLPTIEELRLKEKELCARRNDAISIEDFARAGELQTRLSECREKIKREEEATLAGAEGDRDTCPRDQNISPSDVAENNDCEEVRGSSTRARTESSSSSVGFPSNRCMYSVPLGEGSFTLVIAQLAVTEFEYSNPKAVIVCATNESCHPVHNTVTGAVIDAGGEVLQKQVLNLKSEEETHWGPVRCPTGKAVIVGPASYEYGFDDLHVPWVIFAVGPTYTSDDGKDSLKQKDALLRSAYRSCLELAKKEGLEAVAFSLISGGHRAGDDLGRPIRIAVEVVAESGYEGLKKVQLCAFKKREEILLNEAATEKGLVQIAIDPNA